VNYPLIQEKTLSRPEHRRFRRMRREDVPELPPGATYVFHVGGRYREFTPGTLFDPSHDDVVEASSVSLVDLRVRIVPVDWAVPSISEAGRFTLRATFTCQVTHAVTVAQQGIVDMAGPLGAYLRRDSRLARIGVEHSLDEVNVVREQATARLTAYSAVNPPDVDGMSVEFLAVEVLTPEDVAQHERDRLQEDRRQELGRLRNEYEDVNIGRMATLIAQGSPWVDALALARDELDLAGLSSRHHAAEQDARTKEETRAALAETRAHELELHQRDTKAQLVLTLLRQMGGSESYVDYHQVLEQVLADGSAPAIGGGAVNALGSGRSGPAGAGRNDPPQKEFITDEDELLD
jgi:hypothetical protein